MSRPRGRTGLQTWLIGSFITLGVAASLLMFLVLLPTLEGSIVTGATERTSQATVGVLEDLSEVPGAGYGLTDAEGDAYVRRLASEARGAARYLDIATGWHGADLSAAPGAFPADELTPEGDLADKSFSADPVRVRVAEGPEDQRTVFSAVRVTQGGNVAGLAEGVLLIDPDDQVVVANDAAVRMTGLGPGGQAMRGDLDPVLADLVARARSGESPVDEAEITTPGGGDLAVGAVALSEPTGAGVLTFRDVTQERALARTRRDLVANVSHELKTPVAAIRGFLELMEDDSMPPEARREFVGLMSAEAARLQRLVDEQLQLARLDAGALPMRVEAIDLAAVVRAAARPRAVLAEREGVSLEVQAPSPVPMDGDPERLEQLLLILLDNAARHTPAGGAIAVEAHVEGGDAVMSVADTGEGIPPEAIDSVFDRFYRADAARQRDDRQGAGLGLAIARGLAHAHGGDISVASRPGDGTVFTVRLPRDAGVVSPA